VIDREKGMTLVRAATCLALMLASAGCGDAVAGALSPTEERVERSKLLSTPAKLLPTGASANSQAGASVAIGHDLALVGAPLDAARGAVFV
jgi:hypothetical protein